MSFSRPKVDSTVKHQHPSAVLSQFIAKLATSDDDAPVGVVAHTLIVLPKAEVDIQIFPVNTDADAVCSSSGSAAGGIARSSKPALGYSLRLVPDEQSHGEDLFRRENIKTDNI